MCPRCFVTLSPRLSNSSQPALDSPHVQPPACSRPGEPGTARHSARKEEQGMTRKLFAGIVLVLLFFVTAGYGATPSLAVGTQVVMQGLPSPPMPNPPRHPSPITQAPAAQRCGGVVMPPLHWTNSAEICMPNPPRHPLPNPPLVAVMPPIPPPTPPPHVPPIPPRNPMPNPPREVAGNIPPVPPPPIPPVGT